MNAVLVESLVRYAHFAGILLLVSMLVVENIQIRSRMSGADIRKLVSVDGLYGLGAVVTLLAGLSLWLGVGKPSSFYMANPVFHAKITLFFLIAISSVIPTIFIIKNRRNMAESVDVPKPVILIKRLELLGIALLPLLATLIARGIGTPL